MPIPAFVVALALAVTPPAAPPPMQTAEVVTELVMNVQVQGAVRHPGIYRVAAGTRLADLIARAGGPKRNAQLKNMNLAQHVSDGEAIYVPTIEETRPASPPPLQLAAATHHGHGGIRVKVHRSGRQKGQTPVTMMIGLNTATAAQLAELPGIGQGLAEAIIRLRQTRGRFRALEDLRAVHGIGQKRLERLAPYVRID